MRTSPVLMAKSLAIFTFLVLLAFSGVSQSLSPDQFLGYPLGSRFPYHHDVISYLEKIAAQFPEQTRKIQYGTTYEGRPLMAIVVGSSENMSYLEDIRINHLKSIGLLEGSPTTKTPAIAWLSYNVHGNEAVSSSAFMKVLSDLLDTKNNRSKEILKNTIVILDPCLNPDGYERYVQWYNQRAGIKPNPTPYAWEHREPWPGGRYNHYLFDLNRDWAWQSQKESQDRLLLYNQWMPHVHADFHEMGAGSSYYFPPAAKPFHKDITPWQREFNDILGKYNSREFDKNGWLYFTRFSFDLFYPSYGDTWPVYNGAIGMTYEQAGSGNAGIALKRETEGDTLTLKDRIAHHVTTSFGTLSALSDHAEKTVNEFISYHQNAAQKPTGDFNTYVIKSEANGGSILALRELLDRQGIRYGSPAKNMDTKGINLSTLQEESVSVSKEDIVISAFQPKSRLLKILFEPDPELEDSLTYDITTWAVSFAYGVNAYGLKAKTETIDYKPDSVRNSASGNPYAYLIPWKSYESLQLLSALLQANVSVRTANHAFRIDNQTFDAGTLIVTRKGNEIHGNGLKDLLVRKADSLQVKIKASETGFVTEGMDFGGHAVVPLKARKVVVLAGKTSSPLALGEIWHFFEQQIHYPVTLVNGDDLEQLPWHEIDVLIVPSGNHHSIFNDKELTNLKSWIRTGGKVIIMENALTSFLGKSEFSLIKKETRPDNKNEVIPDQKQYGNQMRDGVSNETPGSVFRVQLDPSHPISFGYNEHYYSLVKGSYHLGYLSDGWNVGWLGKDSYKTGFVGSKISEQLKETLILGTQKMGKGEIIYMADDPLFRGFWYHGKLLFGNAVFR